MRLAITALATLLLLAPAALRAQETVTPPAPITASACAPDAIDWSNPDSIGPLDSDLGAFLDLDLSALQNSADEAYKAGDYERAARYYLALLKQGPRDAAPVYSLACCYGLMGNAELAARYLSRAVALGFSDLGWASWDPDFAKVRGQAAYDTAFAALQEAASAKEAGLGSTIYINGPALMRCRIQLPDNYNAQQAYQLVVGLHGYGASPENFTKLWERFPKHDFIFAIPQAPYAQVEGREIGYSWQPPLPDEDIHATYARLLSEEYVCKVVELLRKEYKTSAVYLLGFSQGCAFTYTTGIKNYGLFNGLICCGGWLDDQWLTPEMLAAAKGLRVLIVQGMQDRLVEPEAADKANELLKQNGYDVTLFTFDGEHRVPPEAAVAISDWLGL